MRTFPSPDSARVKDKSPRWLSHVENHSDGAFTREVRTRLMSGYAGVQDTIRRADNILPGKKWVFVQQGSWAGAGGLRAVLLLMLEVR